MVRGTWALPGPGVEPEPPALAGRLFTTEHRGSPTLCFYWFGSSLADPSMTEKKVLKSPTTDICTHRNEYTKCISAYSGILFSLKKEEILTCAIT